MVERAWSISWLVNRLADRRLRGGSQKLSEVEIEYESEAMRR